MSIKMQENSNEIKTIWRFGSMKKSICGGYRGLGIEVGDFISFDPRVEMTPSGFIKSRHLDDKASVALLMSVNQKNCK